MLLLWLLWQKSFWPWIFPSDVARPQTEEVGCFFSPRTKTQENRFSLLCDIIWVFHLPAKQAWTERDGILFSQNAWFTYSFWMYNNKSDPESGRDLHRISFLNNHCLEWVTEKKEQIGLIFQILTVYSCFMGEWNSKMTSQSKLDPFSSIVVHGPQNRLTSLLWKVTTTEGKIHNPKRFHKSKQGSSQSLFMPKKFWGFVAEMSRNAYFKVIPW